MLILNTAECPNTLSAIVPQYNIQYKESINNRHIVLILFYILSNIGQKTIIIPIQQLKTGKLGIICLNTTVNCQKEF